MRKLNSVTASAVAKMCARPNSGILNAYVQELLNKAKARQQVLVEAVSKGRRIGLGIAEIDQKSRTMFVHLLCTKQGAGCEAPGTGLMREFQRIARQRNVELYRLQAVKRAVGFYKKIGFERTPNARRPLTNAEIQAARNKYARHKNQFDQAFKNVAGGMLFDNDLYETNDGNAIIMSRTNRRNF